MRSFRRTPSGFTLIENLFSVAIVALCFVALYSLSSQALYHVNSGREAVAAKQSLSDRMEQVRGCSWNQLTSASYLQNYVMNTSTRAEGRLGSPVETLTINTYPTPSLTPIQIAWSNGAATTVSTNPALANGDIIRVDLALTWIAAPGKRTRSQSRNTLVARTAP
jgi:prepilin-type N-terminal cleavage/methylation domain-containing protein